jgi:hypothetical protein
MSPDTNQAASIAFFLWQQAQWHCEIVLTVFDFSKIKRIFTRISAFFVLG